ncbi:MAG: ABC transporter ATP-binding protein [Helicobacteraceae bacterium]
MQTKYLSFNQVRKTFLQMIGKHKAAYNKSFYANVVAITAQGLLYVNFYPLLKGLYEQDLGLIWSTAGLMGALAVIFAITRFMGTDYDHSKNATFLLAGYDLRVKLGEKLMKIPLQTLQGYKTGDLNAVFAGNVDEAVMFMGMVPAMFLELVIISAIAIAATLFASWQMGLLTAFALPLAIPLYKLKRRLAIKEKTEFVSANARLESDVIEYIQGIGVLRSINKVGQNAQKLQESIQNVRQVQLEAMVAGVVPSLLMGSLAVVTMLLVGILGVWLAEQNQTSAPVVAAVLIVLSRLIEPASLFLGVSSILNLVETAFRRAKEILELQELQTNTPVQEPKDFGISFENVEFAYNAGDKPALDGVSFSLAPKTMTAIVGTSGSGKTTAIKMLMRYGDPARGAVKIGGADLRAMEPGRLMQNLSVVFQDVYLFNDTILNNIRMGRSGASDDEVRAAAKMAHCDEFIMHLPSGYETQIGDIGGNLSGGEKQRISIARAILKNAPIVMLDEPTAALDTQSEAAVQRAIDELLKDKTILVIAHRLSTITGADKILVFDDAKLVEEGKHNDLLKAKGKYYKMWQAQAASKTWHAKNKKD